MIHPNLNFRNFTAFFIVTSLFFLTMPNITYGQRVPGEVGIGLQVGQPTGLTVKVYNQRSSLDFLAAWDWDNFFFLNIHSVFDTHLNPKETLHFFYGPGAFIGIRDRGPNDDDVALGVSGTFGLDVMLGKFELFIQGTPRLEVVPSTDFDMGGGGGFRIYF